MHISILAVGTRMPRWVADGVETYKKRFPRELGLEVAEIRSGRRSAREDPARAVATEAERLLGRAGSADRIIALDENGSQWSTPELADEVQRWQSATPHVAMLIGGPDGLDPRCIDAADGVWSLSRLTLPHGLVRVLVVEQLYRAWTLLAGHPYHRN